MTATTLQSKPKETPAVAVSGLVELADGHAFVRASGYRRGLADGERQWDKWFDGACGLVDHVTGRHDELPVAGLPGGPPLPAREGEAGGAFFEPRTVSDVSTGALARGPTGAAEVIVTAPPLRSARHGMP